MNDEVFHVLVEEQAALHRVATLVARGVPPEEVFAVVAEEVGLLLAVEFTIMGCYESEATVVTVASWSITDNRFPVGSRWRLEGQNTVTMVYETGRSARIDSYADDSSPISAEARKRGFRSTVGAPITVEGRVWGAIAIGSSDEQPLPADTEARLASFTELVAMAVANAESRAELAQLAEEQAALRRVATLIARGVPPKEVFGAVTEEVGRLLPVEYAALSRYEPYGSITFVAIWSDKGEPLRAGLRLKLEGRNLATLVLETGRSARFDNYADASGSIGARVREATGLRSAAGTPIVVAGNIWGIMVVGTSLEQPLPADTEARLASFTELVATAIANADNRAELEASRARIVAAADETRRRIERDLHDGTQQQLVSLMLELRAAEATQPCEKCDLQAYLARTEQGLDGVLDALREISRGIHPAILSKAGLGSACKALSRRSVVPVELDLRAERRLPEHVEVAAYYVVSEALTNATKHAQASVVNIELDVQDAMLRLTIRDDGVGGADPTQGSGLVGLADRIEALGGRLEITSPASKGTLLSIEIPVENPSVTALPVR